MIEEMDIDDNEQEIDVDMYRWATVKAPQKIGTTGLGPCIGIAIMNDTQKTAWVLHAPNMRHSEEGLRLFLFLANSERQNGDCVRVVVTGGDNAEADHNIVKDRAFTLGLIGELIQDLRPTVAWAEVVNFMLSYDKAWKDNCGSQIFSV